MSKVITPGLTLVDEEDLPPLSRKPSLAGTQPPPEENPLGDRPRIEEPGKRKKDTYPEKEFEIPHRREPRPGRNEDFPNIEPDFLED